MANTQHDIVVMKKMAKERSVESSCTEVIRCRAGFQNKKRDDVKKGKAVRQQKRALQMQSKLRARDKVNFFAPSLESMALFVQLILRKSLKEYVERSASL